MTPLRMSWSWKKKVFAGVRNLYFGFIANVFDHTIFDIKKKSDDIFQNFSTYATTWVVIQKMIA